MYNDDGKNEEAKEQSSTRQTTSRRDLHQGGCRCCLRASWIREKNNNSGPGQILWGREGSQRTMDIWTTMEGDSTHRRNGSAQPGISHGFSFISQLL